MPPRPHDGARGLQPRASCVVNRNASPWPPRQRNLVQLARPTTLRCDVLYAVSHDVDYKERRAFLNDVDAKTSFETRADALRNELSETNARITALQTVALERNMAEALCTGFDKSY